MFDDFAVVIEAEDVHHRLAFIVRRGPAEHMQHRQIAFGDAASRAVSSRFFMTPLTPQLP